MQIPENLIGCQELAQQLGVTKQSVYQMELYGNIPAERHRIGRQYYYDRETLAPWIKATKRVKNIDMHSGKVKTGRPRKDQNRDTFTYSGMQRMAILFCQPNLRNRLSY